MFCIGADVSPALYPMTLSPSATSMAVSSRWTAYPSSMPSVGSVSVNGAMGTRFARAS